MQVGTIIKPDGTTETIRPLDGREFSLAELQRAVGGFIELIPIRSAFGPLIVDEDGKDKGLAVNEKATKLAGMADGDEVVGNAVVLYFDDLSPDGGPGL